nr:acetyltransferase [Gordonia sp. NB41Y]
MTAATDRDVVASLLATAFADDPVMTWTQPDKRKHHSIFATLLSTSYADARLDVAGCDGEPMGAAIWMPPGRRSSRTDDLRALIAFIRILGPRVVQGTIVDAMCEGRRPDEPHWYLADLGAAVQGRGVGTALLRAGIDRAGDAPAYLESSNEVNVPLYERFGFEVTGEIHLPFGGPTLWTMLRRGQGH